MPLLHRYAFSVAAVALAAVARIMLSEHLPGRPFATFFLAVLTTAVIAGAGPAILATLLASLYALAPIDDAPAPGLAVLFFVAISSAVVLLSAIKDHLVGEAADARLKALETESWRMADAALRERERFITGVLNSLPHEIAVIDAQGEVLAVNARWESFARENAQGSVSVSTGANYLEVCRKASTEGDPDARRALEGLQSVLSGDVSEFVMEYPCHTPDGERWLMMHASSVNSPPAAVVVTHTDITTHIQTERRLRAAKQELQRLDERKDAFLATLAHELRNPLAPICTAIPVLRQDAATGWGEKDLALLAIVERQAGNLVRLVDDLLDVSRFTRGKIQLKRQVVDISEAALSAIEIARPNIDKSQHTLTTRFPPEPIHVSGDPVRLAQVFSNLLNNAAKYTDPGGAITLECGQDGDAVVVTVSDNGQGISKEMLPSIFDLFMQTDMSQGGAQAGLGIGLALVKTIVELHGGTVDAHSEGEGRGSAFIVRLPRADVSDWQ